MGDQVSTPPGESTLKEYVVRLLIVDDDELVLQVLVRIADRWTGTLANGSRIRFSTTGMWMSSADRSKRKYTTFISPDMEQVINEGCSQTPPLYEVLLTDFDFRGSVCQANAREAICNSKMFLGDAMIPFAVISGNGGEAVVDLGSQSCGYIQKPVTIEGLKPVLDRLAMAALNRRSQSTP